MELARDTAPTDDVRSADWFAWLDADDQRTCAADFARLLAIGCHHENSAYAQLWIEWSATAEVWHNPEVRAALLDWDVEQRPFRSQQPAP
jgi:hypothetical protein